MKLTKQEKNLLAIERFFNYFKEKFEGVNIVGISSFASENYSKEFNPKNGVYPLYIRVERSKTTGGYEDLIFSWQLGASDDEMPLYTKDGEHFGFHKVKSYVEHHLPEAFKGKSFYMDDIAINSNNISNIILPIKVKLSAINLENDLTKKSVNTYQKKLKI